MNDEATLAVVVARLDDLRTDMQNLRSEISGQRAEVVARNEWMQRNAYVDSRIDGLGTDISELKTDLASRRAPWWSVGAFVVSVITVGFVIVETVVLAKG